MKELVENGLDAGATSIGELPTDEDGHLLIKYYQRYDSKIRAWKQLRCKIMEGGFRRIITRRWP